MTVVPGSSPLARGLPRRRHPRPPRRRIIPARAGFTSGTRGSQSTATDHPRSRGVYMTLAKNLAGTAGSSPLARGLRIFSHSSSVVGGIIPARAGFTSGMWALRSGRRDHPRSRGVYPFGPISMSQHVGSSPLARGLRDTIEEVQTGLMDHPRSRGVYRPVCTWPAASAGSSPLARGLQNRQGPTGLCVRIIPARAGFTSPTSSSPTPPQDHPRSRGVYG